MEHTKLPWKTEGGASDQPDPRWQIYSDSEELTLAVTCGGNDRANGEFIVRACNAYDDLLDACEISSGTFRKLANIGMLSSSKAVLIDNAEIIEAAIKKAGE